MRSHPIPTAIAALLVGALASVLPAQPHPVTSAPTKNAEIISYGQNLSDLRLWAGNQKSDARLDILPPGLLVPISGAESLKISRVETIDGKPAETPLLTVPLAQSLKNPLIVVIPPTGPDKEAPFQARIIDQDLPPSSGALNLYNLTQVPMVVQAGHGSSPAQIPPWGKFSLVPQTDRKHRAHVRVAYRGTSGEWNIVKDSVSGFQPGFYGQFRIVLATQGLGPNADPLNPDAHLPFVYLDERSLPVPMGSIPLKTVGEAPEYQHDYEKIEVLPQPSS